MLRKLNPEFTTILARDKIANKFGDSAYGDSTRIRHKLFEILWLVAVPDTNLLGRRVTKTIADDG